MAGPSGPMHSAQVAVRGPDRVGPEGPPTRAGRGSRREARACGLAAKLRPAPGRSAGRGVGRRGSAPPSRRNSRR
ncbi:DUF6053 domain-containing protein [Lysobacter enzymogenes]|uniref:DUF6053 domain-containing protein n=1 Tax=Lysobacter enzymogenes TaxID=69 RepID=UPI003749FC7E